jgi:hypothetical protein
LPRFNQCRATNFASRGFGGQKPVRRTSALAHAIQSKALGGITKSMDRKLRELAAGKTGPIPGTRYTRAWQGKVYTVIVTEDENFRWLDKDYNRLSQVACAITGTHWSGPAFFGLRQKRAS